MKILAVDDDGFILEILTKLATKLGFPNVSTALSAEIALDLLNSSEADFECLLLDISMPGMDGIELCKVVRALPGYRQTPIIMLTAMTEKVFIDRAFEAGASDYANKPFDIVELGARLRVAEQIVTARHEVKPDGSTLIPSVTGMRHEPGLLTKVRIEGIKGLIDYTSLCNYLTQLSRGGAAGSQIMAIKIDRIGEIYKKASSDEFLYALTEVADAVCAAFLSNVYMMAYAGNGAFVAISSNPGMDPSKDLEAEIQNLLDDKNSEYDNGDPLDIEVSIGNPIRLNLTATQDVQTTFDRAIARAESRMDIKQSTPRRVNIRLIGG